MEFPNVIVLSPGMTFSLSINFRPIVLVCMCVRTGVCACARVEVCICVLICGAPSDFVQQKEYDDYIKFNTDQGNVTHTLSHTHTTKLVSVGSLLPSLTHTLSLCLSGSLSRPFAVSPSVFLSLSPLSLSGTFYLQVRATLPVLSVHIPDKIDFGYCPVAQV